MKMNPDQYAEMSVCLRERDDPTAVLRETHQTDQEPEWCHGFSVRRKLEDGRAAPLWFSVKLSPNSVDKLWFKNEGSIKMFSDVQGPKPLPFAQKGFSTRETIDSHGLFPKLR